jgi:hypothetical protein
VATNYFLDEGLPCLCDETPVDIPWLNATPVTGTVSAGGWSVVDVTFTALPTMTVGIAYTATFRLQTNDPLLGRMDIPVTLTIDDGLTGPDLEPELSIRLGQPGQVVIHRLVLENLGWSQDTFQITYSSTAAGWSVDLSETAVTLEPDQRVEILVRVTIPAGAGMDDFSTLSISAASSSDPALIDQVELGTFIADNWFYFPLVQLPALP